MQPRTLALSTPALAWALAMGCAPAAEAAEPGARTECEVIVGGAENSSWAVAVSRLEQGTLSRAIPLACQKLVLWIHAHGATVQFWAPHGASAARSLRDPTELEATVIALALDPFAAVPEPAPEPGPGESDDETEFENLPRGKELPSLAPAAASESPSADTALSGWSGPGLSQSKQEPTRRGSYSAVVEDTSGRRGAESKVSVAQAAMVALEAGIRAGADRIAMPYVEGLVALGTASVELGVTARYEPWYGRVGVDPDGQAEGWGIGTGLRVARRQDVATSASVLIGGQMQIAAVAEGLPGRARAGSLRVEPRVGVYTGLLAGRSPQSAFRTTLGIDVLPHARGRSIEAADGDPLSPWWALAVGFGGQFGGA